MRDPDPLGPAVPPSQSALGKSLGWSLLNQGIVRAVNLAFGIALARLVAPEEFGVVAVALTALSIVISLNDLGLLATVTRWPGRLDAVVRTATTAIWLSSLALFLAAWFAAPLYAGALNTPQATTSVRLLALVLFIDAACGIPAAILQRRLRSLERLVADLLGFAVSVPLTLVLVSVLDGATSIALGRLAGSFVTASVILCLAPARPLPGWDSGVARVLLRTGLPLAAAGLLDVALLNLDYLVLGSMLGPTALGFYLLAFNISSWPMNVVAMGVHRVAVPAMASMGDDPQALRIAIRRAFDVLAVLTLCGVVGLGLVAGPLVDVVYGHRWHASVAPLVVLVGLGGIRVLVGLLHDALLAAGRGRRLLALKGTWLLALLPALPIGVHLGGGVGAAYAHVAVAAVVVVPLLLWLSAPVTGVSARDVLAAAGRASLPAGPALACGLLVREMVHQPALQLLSVSVTVAFVHLGLSAPMLRAALQGSGRHAVRSAQPDVKDPVPPAALELT